MRALQNGNMRSCQRSGADVIWRAVLVWAAVDLAIMALVQRWGLVWFGLLFGLAFGGISWRVRGRLRPALERLGLANLTGFLLLALAISAFEEGLCWALGNATANPILWADLIQVCVGWSFWFATWYLYLGRRFAYSERESLLLGASVGVLFEGVSSGFVFVSPLLVVLGAPLVLVIYAAVFVLPLQLIDRTGSDRSRWRYPVAVFLPYVASLPAGVVLAIALPR
jgi:hypothetical protein